MEMETDSVVGWDKEKRRERRNTSMVFITEVPSGRYSRALLRSRAARDHDAEFLRKARCCRFPIWTRLSPNSFLEKGIWIASGEQFKDD